jgi:chromosome segregation ATPase
VATGEEPRLSWATIVGAISVVGLMTAAQWVIFQNEFSDVRETIAANHNQAATELSSNKADIILRETELKSDFGKYLTKDEHLAYLDGIKAQLTALQARVLTLETELSGATARLAHDPVEDRTFQATVSAADKRVDLIQAQITDINRQIAAVLIAVENNTTAKKAVTVTPQ